MVTAVRCRYAARMLRSGGVLAHSTATVAGITAHPYHPHSVFRMQAFKQRQGPFLLLAANNKQALSLALGISPLLRRLAKQSWPGDVTLVFRGRPGLPVCCYQRGNIAVRVDASVQVRHLAHCCGGLLLSSSLNRRAQPLLDNSRQSRFRYQRWLDARIPPPKQAKTKGQASALYLIRRANLKQLR